MAKTRNLVLTHTHVCSRIEKTIKTIGDLTIRGRSNYVLQLTEFIIHRSGRLLLLENAIVYRNSIEREAPQVQQVSKNPESRTSFPFLNGLQLKVTSCINTPESRCHLQVWVEREFSHLQIWAHNGLLITTTPSSDGLVTQNHTLHCLQYLVSDDDYWTDQRRFHAVHCITIQKASLTLFIFLHLNFALKTALFFARLCSSCDILQDTCKQKKNQRFLMTHFLI